MIFGRSWRLRCLFLLRYFIIFHWKFFRKGYGSRNMNLRRQYSWLPCQHVETRILHDYYFLLVFRSLQEILDSSSNFQLKICVERTCWDLITGYKIKGLLILKMSLDHDDIHGSQLIIIPENCDNSSFLVPLILMLFVISNVRSIYDLIH